MEDNRIIKNNSGFSENIDAFDEKTPVRWDVMNERFGKLLSNTMWLKKTADGEKRDAECVIYYGCTVPTTEAEVEEMARSDFCTFKVPKGRYVIASEVKISRIRDKNLLDITEDFEERRVGKYYVYVFGHETVIDMEFTIYF